MLYRSLLFIAFSSLACSSYQMGACRAPVASLSRASLVTHGSHATVRQDGATLVVCAVHLCDVVEHEEHTSGALAEHYKPGFTQEVARHEREREANQVGPLDVNGVRNVDSASERRLDSELVHGVTNPWVVGAAVTGLLDTLLVAHTRVEAKVAKGGEHAIDERASQGVPCHDNALVGAEVTVAMPNAQPRVVGTTDGEGCLRAHLDEALASYELFAKSPPDELVVAVDGERAGSVDAGPVAGAIALRSLQHEAHSASAAAPAGTADRRLVDVGR